MEQSESFLVYPITNVRINGANYIFTHLKSLFLNKGDPRPMFRKLGRGTNPLSLPPREKIGSIERISAHLARFEGDGKKNAVVNPATRCVSRYFTSGVEGRGEFHSSGKSWREKLASSPSLDLASHIIYFPR